MAKLKNGHRTIGLSGAEYGRAPAVVAGQPTLQDVSHKGAGVRGDPGAHHRPAPEIGRRRRRRRDGVSGVRDEAAAAA